MSEAERAGVSRQDKNARLLAGRYRLGDVLGRGGMGTVWRAEDETLGRTVAVKELRFPGNIDDEEKRRLITRTLREAKAIARIRNNSAVTVFDVVDEDDRPWIVMELVEGKSLAEVIREDGVLDPRRAAEVGLAILDVLRSAHREGILHRDVKPSNVLIAEDGRVVLTDFGIAQVEGDPSITSTGMLVGAPSYISPERARGHKPGPAADLWSLGGLLYAAVEGTPPYDKGSAIATLTAVMTEPLEEPKNAGPLKDVIYGLLTKDAARRLDDAGAREKLNAVLHAPAAGAVEPPDATKVVPLPPQPDGTDGKGGASGAEPGEKLRGALRSVRKAAVAAGAATTAAAGRGKSSGPAAGSGSTNGSGQGSATGRGSSGTPAPGAPASGGASAGTAAVPAARDKGTTKATAASASVPASRTAGAASTGAQGATGAEAPAARGTNGSTAGRSSGWPVMTPPDLPPRPVPKAPLTDVVPRRTLVIIAVVVALAVLGTVLALTLGDGDGDANGAKGGGASSVASGGTDDDTKNSQDDTKGDATGGTRPDGSATGTAPAPGASPGGNSTGTGTGSDGPASGTDGSGTGTSTGGKGGAAGTVTKYSGQQGYTIGLPAGWKYQSSDGAGDRFTGPDGQRLLVAWTNTPKDDPVADWKNQERGMKRSQYQKIRIEKVDYRGWNTADWEFTYADSGVKYRSIDRGFVVNDHLGHALMYSAKAAGWDGALRESTWKTLTETFTPKK
ncbi:protein kinase [Streptomyces sp. NPDC091281]|uniref:serine/threonine-protein kinase n=1 Tax=Streptomyces sp. NPDC091281 TaxID=3365985 RepID=UPI0038291DBE